MYEGVIECPIKHVVQSYLYNYKKKYTWSNGKLTLENESIFSKMNAICNNVDTTFKEGPEPIAG